MDKPKVMPKDFFLWAGAMVALYWSIVSFIFLIFNYIDYSFPNPLSYYTDPYQSGVPYEMASIIVLFPAYVLLMWVLRRDILRDPSRKDLWVRRWALIGTLFVAGATIAGDLIVLLTSFLSGNEITEAFLLKTLLVLLVAVGGFLHFFADLRGYWDVQVMRKRVVCSAVGVLAAVTIFGGFLIIGTPQQARERQFDNQKVSDLENIEYQVVSYWQYHGVLPQKLSDLNNTLSNVTVPVDEQTGQPYGYQATGAMTFNLCADFNAQSQGQPYITTPEPMGLGGQGGSENWQHGAGNVCFSRTIDPRLYPPIPTTK